MKVVSGALRAHPRFAVGLIGLCSLGGGKVAGNRHIRIPGRKVTELLLTLQQVMGLKVDTWGRALETPSSK